MNYTKTFLYLAAIVYALFMWGLAFAQSTEWITFSDVSVVNGKVYSIELGPVVGEKVYADRTFTFKSVPPSLHGSVFFRGHNDDKVNTSPSFLKFTPNKAVDVYVGIDVRIPTKPSWIVLNYEATGEKMVTSEHTMDMYKKEVDAGTPVDLPGLAQPSTQYVVVVKPKTEQTCVTGKYQLRWDLGTEPDLAEYVLYRSSGTIVDAAGKVTSVAEAFATIKKPFPLVTPTPAEGPRVTSPFLNHVAGVTYYVVVAKDATGNASGPSNVVGCNVTLPIILKDPQNLRVE